MVRRFGSALNLIVHFHMLLLDGVYVADSADRRWCSALWQPPA